MCKTRNSKSITMQDRTFRVDGCMVDKLETINIYGKSLGCCCGHGRYPETIVVSILGRPYEYHSGTHIPRTRRFYKTDADGYYYIPEISEPQLEE